MKSLKLLISFLLLSVNFFAGTVTATYSARDIPTTINASVTTGSRATDPGLLTVTIPVDAIITSVDVAYSMTATSLGYMSEQRSFIFCSSMGGTVEAAVYSGVGNASGTYPYSRTGLTIANNVTGGGDILFELHAFRIYGNSGSESTYNYVANNSWQITVNYVFVEPPTNFITTAYTNQIQLSWTKNAANNNVMVAYNTTNTFGTPTNKKVYPLYSDISGGGVIMYKGSSTTFSHSNLKQGTKYFYKIWTVTESNYYSMGVEGNATTDSVQVVSNLTYIAYITQIQLSWEKNPANNNVIVAYSTSNLFGNPTDGLTYSVNSSINGGGEIIYNGSSTTFSHSNLKQGTKYFYKIWAVNEKNSYSTGITGNVVTNSVPVVSNVTFTNNISTTGMVDINYDVNDAEQSTVTVSMEVSNDSGKTFNFACTQLTGDIGTGVLTGTNRHIVWNFNREHPGVTGNKFIIKILADDLVGDQIYYGGKIYNTVIIGSQIWLKENLDIGTMIQGTTNQSNNGTIEKYCYNNKAENCATYGGLYQWNEAMQYSTVPGTKGICPAGWHIPTDQEFQILYTTVSNDGNKLKALGQGNGSGRGTNTSGFSALLAGDYYEGNFYDSHSYALFWNSGYTADATRANSVTLNSQDDDFYINSNIHSKEYGFSIRCLEN